MTKAFSQYFMDSSAVNDLTRMVPEHEQAAFREQLARIVSGYDVLGDVREEAVIDALQAPVGTAQQPASERRLPRRQ